MTKVNNTYSSKASKVKAPKAPKAPKGDKFYQDCLKDAYNSIMLDITRVIVHKDAHMAVFRIIASRAVDNAKADKLCYAHGSCWNVNMVLRRLTSMQCYKGKCVNGNAEEVKEAAKDVCREILNSVY